MKDKNSRKKLMLNKKTISRLNEVESKKVYGGNLPPLTWTCNIGTRCGSGLCC